MLLVHLLDDLLLQVFWADVMQIQIWRAVCRRLYALSKTRTTWIGALAQFNEENPDLQPKLELPITFYEAEDIERLVLRLERLRLNWTADDPKIYRLRDFYALCTPRLDYGHGYPLPILISGGRWLLVQAESDTSAVLAFDLNSPDLEGAVLVQPEPQKAIQRLTLRHNVDYDSGSDSFAFNLGIYRHFQDPQAANKIALSRVKLQGETYKTSRLHAEHIILLDIRPSHHSFFLSGDVIITLTNYFQMDVWRWKESDPNGCPVSSLEVGSRLAHQVKNVEYIREGCIVIFMVRSVELYDIPEFKRVRLEGRSSVTSEIPQITPRWSFSLREEGIPRAMRASLKTAIWAPTPLHPAITIVFPRGKGVILLPLPGDPNEGCGLAIKVQKPPHGYLSTRTIFIGSYRGMAMIGSHPRYEIALLSYVYHPTAIGSDTVSDEDAEPSDIIWELRHRLVELDEAIRYSVAFDEQLGRALLMTMDGRLLVYDFA